jgi:hypothetical protein
MLINNTDNQYIWSKSKSLYFIIHNIIHSLSSIISKQKNLIFSMRKNMLTDCDNDKYDGYYD